MHNYNTKVQETLKKPVIPKTKTLTRLTHFNFSWDKKQIKLIVQNLTFGANKTSSFFKSGVLFNDG